jgi:hypothetical protein
MYSRPTYGISPKIEAELRSAVALMVNNPQDTRRLPHSVMGSPSSQERPTLVAETAELQINAGSTHSDVQDPGTAMSNSAPSPEKIDLQTGRFEGAMRMLPPQVLHVNCYYAAEYNSRMNSTFSSSSEVSEDVDQNISLLAHLGLGSSLSEPVVAPAGQKNIGLELHADLTGKVVQDSESARSPEELRRAMKCKSNHEAPMDTDEVNESEEGSKKVSVFDLWTFSHSKLDNTTYTTEKRDNSYAKPHAH